MAVWERRAIRSARHIGELAIFSLICLPAGVAMGGALWQVPAAVAQSPLSLEWVRLLISRPAG
jgi:hypothetical protein